VTEDAVPLFNDPDANLPEARLDVPRLGRPERDKTSGRATDLTGKAKAIMAIGLGATGKTTLLRWLCERALERSDDELALATVDPVNRELGHYFPAAMAPPTQDPAQVTAWLEQLLAMVMETGKSVALDFGGGDTTLARLLAEVPDLQQMMEGAGIEPVALYPLTPRSSDLTPLAAMAQAGFRPKATALILNEGRAIARDLLCRSSDRSEGIRSISRLSRRVRSKSGCHASTRPRLSRTGGSVSGVR